MSRDIQYKICALITTYYPDIQVLGNVNKIAKQVTSVIIADNTPNVDNSVLFSKVNNIVYISNAKNLGLSAAFNRLLNIELSKKSDFILFFDQDSDVSEDLVERLIAEYMVLLERKCRIGCLGPMIFERSLNVKISPKRKLDIVNNSCRVEAIITSSMLTTYRNLEAIGFWNEDIFLDFADWDLCWRFQKNNLLCYITDNVLLNHKLGYSVKKIGNYQIIEDNPIREYYQIRDGIKLLFKSYTPFRYRIHFLILIVFRPYLHMLFLKNRYLRIKYIITGIIDFFRCKSNALV